MYSNEYSNYITIDTLNDEFNQILSRPNRFVPIDVVYDRLGLNYKRMLNPRSVYSSELGIIGWYSDENGNQHCIDLKDWNYKIAQKLLNCEWLK